MGIASLVLDGTERGDGKRKVAPGRGRGGGTDGENVADGAQAHRALSGLGPTTSLPICHLSVLDLKVHRC